MTHLEQLEDGGVGLVFFAKAELKAAFDAYKEDSNERNLKIAGAIFECKMNATAKSIPVAECMTFIAALEEQLEVVA